jgi:RNA polymerase sigma-70 factor, ECF subfamily
MPTSSAAAVAGDAVGAVTEDRLRRALLAGDEDAFASLVDRHGPAMRRVARGFVGSHAAADEVVQETWLAVLAGLERFEHRCSLRTWIFQILINRAKTHGIRERRTVPLSTLDERGEGPVVCADRFFGPATRARGQWAAPPRPWQSPERRALSLEARARLREALRALPQRQQLAVTMRDVEGLSAEEVCKALGVTPENQRVLLHRGRSQLREVLESYVDEAA